MRQHVWSWGRPIFISIVHSLAIKKRKLPPNKKVTHSIISSFSFDYGTNLLWHFAKLLQIYEIVMCCIHFPFLTKMLYEDGRVGWQSQGFSSGLSSGLCGGQWCLVFPEPPLHNLSLINPGIGILECAGVIGQEKNPFLWITCSFSIFRFSADLIL